MSTAQIHLDRIWAKFGIPVTMRLSSDGVLRFCHEALRSLLRATKPHKAAGGFCFVIRSSLCRAAGCGHEGNTDCMHKIRRGTIDGSRLCTFWLRSATFRRRGRNLEFRASCREGCWAPQRRRMAVSFDTKPHRKKSCCGRHVPWLSSFQGCECRLVQQAPQTKIVTPLTRGLLLCGHA